MTWVTLRCPRCGAFVAAPSVAVPGPTWASCPHCQNPLPVLATRDPPPLFSWEAYPNVYPSLPTPKAPGRRMSKMTAIVLVATTILLASLAGLLVGTGAAALSNGSYTLAGSVLGQEGPGRVAIAATIHLLGEAGFNVTFPTGPGGLFSIPGVPAGGISVNVSAPGYQPEVLELFLSNVYQSVSDPQALSFVLAPGSGASTTFVGASSFGDLEGFLTSLWSAAAVLVIAAVLAGAGAVAAFRYRRPGLAVAGGAAAAAAPSSLFLLGDIPAFPMLAVPVLALVSLGAVALMLGAIELGWSWTDAGEEN
jgi:hypothetical protein